MAIDKYCEVIKVCQPIVNKKKKDKEDYEKFKFDELMSKVYSNLAKCYMVMKKSNQSIYNFE